MASENARTREIIQSLCEARAQGSCPKLPHPKRGWGPTLLLLAIHGTMVDRRAPRNFLEDFDAEGLNQAIFSDLHDKQTSRKRNRRCPNAPPLSKQLQPCQEPPSEYEVLLCTLRKLSDQGSGFDAVSSSDGRGSCYFGRRSSASALSHKRDPWCFHNPHTYLDPSASIETLRLKILPQSLRTSCMS